MATKSRGQSLVEFALILPILLVLVVVVADLARVIAAHVALSNAAREGARYASLHPSDLATTRTRVLQEYNNTGIRVTGVELQAGNISISFPNASDEPGNPVLVTVRCRFPLFFAAWFPAGVVDANGTMLVERTALMTIM